MDLGKIKYLVNLEDETKYFFVDEISDDELNPLTDGAENLLLFDATCYQKFVTCIFTDSKEKWILSAKSNELLEFKCNHFSFSGLEKERSEAKLVIDLNLNKQSLWYDYYSGQSLDKLSIGEDFTTGGVLTTIYFMSDIAVFSSKPSKYKRYYEEDEN